MKKIAGFFITCIVFLSIFSPALTASENSDMKLFHLIVSWQMEKAEKYLPNAPDYLKGLYEFYMGNYDGASELMSNAPEEFSVWQDRIADIQEIQKNFKTIRTDRFIIRYSGKDEVIALYLQESIERCASIVDEVFDHKPTGEVVIEIYPDKASFQKASTLTDQQIKVSGAIGICKFNRIMIASPRILKFGYNWKTTINHEYVHYVIAKLTALENMPLWLNEGLAKYVEDFWYDKEKALDPVDVNYIVKSRTDNTWVDLEKMRHGMPTLETSEEVSLAFAQVEAMTRYMIETYGFNKLNTYLKGLKTHSRQKQFKSVFKISMYDFQKNWQEYIKTASLEITPGASGPSYALNEDSASAVSEWVSDMALTDVKIAKRFEIKGRYKLAERKYIQALSKDPGNAVILNRLAKIQMKHSDIISAEKNFKRALQTNNSYAPLYLHLAELMFQRSDYVHAADYLVKYINISPFNPESHKLLQDIYEKTNDLKRSAMEQRMYEILVNNY